MKKTIFMKRCRFFFVCLLILTMTMEPVSGYSILQDENVYSHHANTCMKIALTFDDGPSPYYTAAILDYLKAENIHATFFVVGSMARANPALVCREEAEGHEIGNHTDSHPRIQQHTMEELRRELLGCESTVYELTDYRPLLFRPPEGYCSEAVSALAASLDYRVIIWNIDTRDWARDTNADGIAEGILSNVKSGDIILFHDSVSRKDSQTLAALQKAVPVLKERGYRFVTVSELLDTESAS